MLLLEGAAIALVSVLVGRLLPNRRRTPKPAPPPQPICGCTHHHSFHDPATRACRGVTRQRKYSNGGSDLGIHPFPCTCQQYSGPTPMPELFAPEIGA